MGTFPSSAWKDQGETGASVDAKTPHKVVQFTSQDDDSLPLRQPGNIQSQNSSSRESSDSGSGLPKTTSVPFLAKFKTDLEYFEKKSQAVKNTSKTSALDTLNGGGFSSKASRGSVTMAHSARGLDQERLAEEDFSKPALSQFQSSPDTVIKRPPRDRVSYFYKDDISRKEDDLTMSSDSFVSGQRPKPVDEYSSEKQRVFSPLSVNPVEQNYIRESRDDFDRHSGGSHRHSGDSHPHSGDSHPHSGESHPHSGKQSSFSGEHRAIHSGGSTPNSGGRRSMSREHVDPLLKERQPHSGEQIPPLDENVESSFHNRSASRLSSNNSAEKTLVTPIPAKRGMRPKTTPVKTDTCCIFCKAIIEGVVKFCPECGNKDPLACPDSSSSDLDRSVSSPCDYSTQPPMRASVKETKQVEEKHLTMLQQPNKRETDGSQKGLLNWDGTMNNSGGSRHGEGRLDNDRRKVAGQLDQGDSGYDRQDRPRLGDRRGGAGVGGAGNAVKSNVDRDEDLVGGVGKGNGPQLVENEDFRSTIQNNLESIKYTEEEKRQFHEEHLRKKAAKEREKENKEMVDSEHEWKEDDRRRESGGCSATSGRSDGASASETNLTVKQGLEAIRKAEQEEKEKRKQEHLRRQGIESERRGQFKNNTMSLTDQNLSAIQQAEKDEKERRRQEFLGRKTMEQKTRVKGDGRNEGDSDLGGAGGQSSPSRRRRDRQDNYIARLDREGKQLLQCVKVRRCLQLWGDFVFLILRSVLVNINFNSKPNLLM